MDKRYDRLRIDAKTLDDISKMMDREGSYTVLPSVLRGIVMDILSVTDEEAVGIEER